jgi:hypothetical protein
MEDLREGPKNPIMTAFRTKFEELHGKHSSEGEKTVLGRKYLGMRWALDDLEQLVVEPKNAEEIQVNEMQITYLLRAIEGAVIPVQEVETANNVLFRFDHAKILAIAAYMNSLGA